MTEEGGKSVMEEMTKVIELLQVLSGYIKNFLSLKASITVFLTSVIFLALLQIPVISSILSIMESTIRALIVIIVMTSGAYSIALFSLDFIVHLFSILSSLLSLCISFLTGGYCRFRSSSLRVPTAYSEFS